MSKVEANVNPNFAHDLCILFISGVEYIVPIKDATVVLQVLNRAEMRSYEAVPTHVVPIDPDRYKYVIKHLHEGAISIKSLSLIQLTVERGRWQEWHDVQPSEAQTT